MLKVQPEPEAYEGHTLGQWLNYRKPGEEPHVLSLKEKVDKTIELLKRLDIDGCITGSCLLEDFDPDSWGTTPDVDIFVYGEQELQHAIDVLTMQLRMEPGTGTARSREQEEWKLNQLRTDGINRKAVVCTHKFFTDGVIVNVTYKREKVQGHWLPIKDATSVLRSFDMSIVMQAYDIKSHIMFDMRVGDPKVAVPNPLRDHGCMMWNVAKWVRQFDRVVKYYGRGYDTRPMARFYLDMIDQCIDAGCLFDSEESREYFDTMTGEFREKRADIKAWLDEHEED